MAPILDYARLPWPTNWADVFGREAPLLLEIGFGGGKQLVERAQAKDRADHVGLEISLPSLKRGAKKIEVAGLSNAIVVRGDALAALWLLFAPQMLGGVTINFPDPWPKPGHEHRRLINPRFLAMLASRMRPLAPLDIATDHEVYAEAIEAVLRESPLFDSRTSAPFSLQPDGRRHTKYESIALAEGRTPRYFQWQRNYEPALEQFPIPEERTVPHVIILSTLSLDQLADRFRPFHAQAGDTHVKFLDLYSSQDGQTLLVDAYVSEEPYHQRVGLSIRRRVEGDLVVGLHQIGFSRPTPGIHAAVGLLTAWLQEEDPQLEIVNSTLANSPQDDRN